MNILISVFLHKNSLFLEEILLGLRLCIFLTILNTDKLISKGIDQFIFPSALHECSHCSTSLSTLSTVRLLFFANLIR